MTPDQVALLVLGILGAQVAIWVPVVLWIRSRNRALVAALAAGFASSGEAVVIAPEPVLYGGATESYPKAGGNSVAALTARRLVVRRLVGEGFEIAREDITGAREEAWFRRSRRSVPWVVVTTRGGAELGLIVRDRKAWLTALARK
jgi:hypothetical protein